jgi:hypothetical protein
VAGLLTAASLAQFSINTQLGCRARGLIREHRGTG